MNVLKKASTIVLSSIIVTGMCSPTWAATIQNINTILNDTDSTEYTLEDLQSEFYSIVEEVENKTDAKSIEIQEAIENLQELGLVDENYVLGNTPTEGQLIEEIQQFSLRASTSSFALQAKMFQNADTVSSIFSNYYVIFQSYAQAYAMTALDFYNLVKTGGPWDYKQDLGYNTVYRCVIDSYIYYLTGEQIGNINYGYAGSPVFSKNVLCYGGGFANILSDGSVDWSLMDSYFDDPNDIVEIERGIDYYRTGTFN